MLNYVGFKLQVTCTGTAGITVVTPRLCIHAIVHTIVDHPNQEGDICNRDRTSGLMAESVYGGDIQLIDTDH